MKYEELPRDESSDIDILKVEFPVEFPQATPLQADGTKVARLPIRESTVGDVEVADRERSGLSRVLRMLSAVAELSPEDVRSLATQDYVHLHE